MSVLTSGNTTTAHVVSGPAGQSRPASHHVTSRHRWLSGLRTLEGAGHHWFVLSDETFRFTGSVPTPVLLFDS